jgi:hypothetical protein
LAAGLWVAGGNLNGAVRCIGKPERSRPVGPVSPLLALTTSKFGRFAA